MDDNFIFNSFSSYPTKLKTYKKKTLEICYVDDNDLYFCKRSNEGISFTIMCFFFNSLWRTKRESITAVSLCTWLLDTYMRTISWPHLGKSLKSR